MLGAGGVSAWALHFGAARALESLGLGLGDATRVVGTSAGAAVAAAVLGGTSAEQALADVLQPPQPEERQRYLAEVRAHNRRRSWLPAAPHLVRHVLPGGAGAGVAWAGLAPAGVFPGDSLARFPGLDSHRGWPSQLWVVTVALSDGARVVLGRDREDVDVATAVRASQSVPLLFTPADVDGDRLVDGAVHSSTNADLLLEDPPDLAVVLAPMARRGGGLARALARSRGRAELLALRDAGIRTVALRPGPELEPLLRSYRSDPDAPAALVDAGDRMVHNGLRGTDVS